MSFKATVMQVLIASPSDLAEERLIVTEVIHDWNSLHASAESIVLLPVKWETHAVPTVGVRPQEAINKQLVESSDLLIGLFWTRIGSNTGVAPSGTAEEIDQFVAADKPAMLYFSRRPIAPDKIDPDQHARLKEFQQMTYKTALVGNFASIEELSKILSRDLTNQVRSMKPSIPVEQPAATEPRKALVVDILSADAKEILIQAAQGHGQLIMSRTNHGLSINTHGRKFGNPQDNRNQARWKEAFDQLLEQSLIQDQGRGTVFSVTHRGYAVVKELNPDQK